MSEAESMKPEEEDTARNEGSASELSPLNFGSVGKGIVAFFFDRIDMRMAGVIRIMFGVILLVNLISFLPHLETFFTSRGLWPLEIARNYVDTDTWSLFDYFPESLTSAYVFFGFLILSTLCLTLGLFTRTSNILVFIMVVSLQHRVHGITDGQDTVARLLCFLILFLPAGRYYSLDNILFKNREDSPLFVAWPMRLMQIQMAGMVFSAGMAKINAGDWLAGMAVYYTLNISTFFHMPLPDFVRYNPALSVILTYTAISIEFLCPIFIWFKKTRVYCVSALLFFFLGMFYCMKLLMFPLFMIVGLMSFVGVEDLQKGLRWFKGLIPKKPADRGEELAEQV